ncbi:hypothetical protein Vretimale_12044 [Volvox reticuliferus]|uniref:Uncharacterized protein n=1 Tax=Volvox reticuliferus TaxID=1737510 RepID=A0A8J4GIH2_9CHLO|nr:hypothetical protein Vretimale_12044 [Volvox reticuliferus]
MTSLLIVDFPPGKHFPSGCAGSSFASVLMSPAPSWRCTNAQQPRCSSCAPHASSVWGACRRLPPLLCARASAALPAVAKRPATAQSRAFAATAVALTPFPRWIGATSQRVAASGGAAPIVDPARLVSTLEKLARVGQAPQPGWLDMYLAVIEPALPQLSIGELATLARALGRLGLEVPEPLAKALLQASEAVLRGAERAADIAALLTWAAADGRLIPEPAWVGSALQQYLSLRRPGGLSPSQAADVAWAVARMGYRPANPLLDCLAAATLESSVGGSATAADVHMFGWEGDEANNADPRNVVDKRVRQQRLERDGESSGPWSGRAEERLDLDPDPSSNPNSNVRAAAHHPADTGLSELPPEQLARLAWAFASFNYFPPDEWLQAYWLRGIWIRGLSPEGATAVLWSLGCMQLPLEPLWLRNYCLTTTGRLHEIPPEGLVNALWAIAACREVARVADGAVVGAAAGAEQGRPATTNAAAAAAGNGTAAGAVGPGRVAATAAMAGEGADVEKEEMDEEAARRRLRDAGLEYAAGAELLQQQLQALLQLRDGGGATAAQRKALNRLQEALDRRLSSGTAAVGIDGASASQDAAAVGGVSLPAAWMEEWYNATMPYLELPYMDRTLVVKALWAAASLELAPPPGWLQRLAAVAATLLADGAFEPLEILYASRSADGLLSLRVVRALPAAEEPSWKVQCDQHAGEGEEVAREMLGRFAADSFASLGRQQQLPPSWRRLNPRFPPYAQPKPGTEAPGVMAAAGPDGGAGRGGADGVEGFAAGESSRALVPAVPGAGLLRPFR